MVVIVITVGRLVVTKREESGVGQLQTLGLAIGPCASPRMTVVSRTRNLGVEGAATIATSALATVAVVVTVLVRALEVAAKVLVALVVGEEARKVLVVAFQPFHL